MTQVSQEIEKRLFEKFSPWKIHITDETALHQGHLAYRGKNAQSHFHVHMVSAVLQNKTRLERQREVYAALADLMQPDSFIHALSLKLETPEEFQARKTRENNEVT